MNPSVDASYWDFSWYEMATIDVPTVIEYVLEQTDSKKLDYIGHSQGTLTLLIALDKFQKVQKSVRHFYGLGPIAFLQNIKSPLAYLANSVFAPKIVYQKWHQEILPSNEAGVWLSEKIGGLVAGGHGTSFLTLFVGFHPKRYQVKKMATYLAHFTSGASMQSVLHFAQMIRTGRIQKYSEIGDDDKTEGSVDFTNIEDLSVTFFCGRDDVFSDYDDVDRLGRILKEKNQVDIRKFDDFDHLSYLWGNTAFLDVYRVILKKMQDDDE